MKKTLKEKRKYIIIGAIVAMVIIAASVSVYVVPDIKRQKVYDQCVEMVLEGNWRDTIDTFQSLAESNYKASRDFHTFCLILKYYQEGNIAKAYDLIYNLKNYHFEHEQWLIIMEYWPPIRDAYTKKYGDPYSTGSYSGGSNKPLVKPDTMCQYGDCTNPKVDPGKYCESHTCRVYGCYRPISSNGSYYCYKHKPTNKKDNNDQNEYNVFDYDDPDDFYDDYFYEFEDYDEAEQYWDEFY